MVDNWGGVAYIYICIYMNAPTYILIYTYLKLCEEHGTMSLVIVKAPAVLPHSAGSSSPPNMYQIPQKASVKCISSSAHPKKYMYFSRRPCELQSMLPVNHKDMATLNSHLKVEG